MSRRFRSSIAYQYAAMTFAFIFLSAAVPALNASIEAARARHSVRTGMTKRMAAPI